MPHLTRRQLLASAAAAGVSTFIDPSRLLSQSTRPAKPQAAGGPNVLMLMVDDLRPQLGCYGHDNMLSPNIDALAESGTRFDRAYCQVAVCGASRASLLTGMRPTRERYLQFYTRAEEDAPDAVPMQGLFKDAGYRAVSLGKVFHHPADFADRWSERPWRDKGEFPGYATGSGLKGKAQATQAVDAPADAFPDGRIAERAIAELRGFAESKQPFFLATGFVKPHLAFACPQKYWDMYDRSAINLDDNPIKPEGAPKVAMHNWGELREYNDIPRRGPLDEAKARELIHGYYACVSFIDAQVGRVLHELDELGLSENTIVILLGDHGYHLRDHGLWCKHSNFENAVHVPMIVRTPMMDEPGEQAPRASGQSSDALVEFVDLYPSLCELCGLTPPGGGEQLQGTSLVPLLREPGRGWKQAAFSQYARGKTLGESIRTDRFRFTRWSPPSGDVVGLELYDHALDPGENTNAADLPEYNEDVQRLTDMLEAGWRAAVPA